jgi:hypothetical protein
MQRIQGSYREPGAAVAQRTAGDDIAPVMLAYVDTDIAHGSCQHQGRRAIPPAIALLKESGLRKHEGGVSGRKTVGSAVRPLAKAGFVEAEGKAGIEDLTERRVAQLLLSPFAVTLEIRGP